MLDLPAAFNTIDHDILMSRLCNVYGITGDALDWFMSLFTWRVQHVVIEDSVSVDQEIGFGVPQMLWVRRFIACTPYQSTPYTIQVSQVSIPVSAIIQWHGLSHHSYADDTPLYMTIEHSNNNWWDGLTHIQLCVSEIKEKITQNMLKLNDDKTDLIVFYFNTPKLKKTLSLTTAATQQTLPHTHTQSLQQT